MKDAAVYAKALLKITIICTWIAMIGLLVQRTGVDQPTVEVGFSSVPDTLDFQQEWMGIYLRGKKAGYAVTTQERIGDLYVIREHSLMYLRVSGTKQRIEYRLRTTSDVEFTLRSFDSLLSSDGVEFGVAGEIKDGNLDLIVRTGNREERVTLSLDDVPFLTSCIKPYMVRKGLEIGKRYRFPFFDPSTMSKSEMLIHVEGKEELESDGAPVVTYRLRETYKGIETIAWVTEKGETIKEESPLGFTLVKESQEEAISGEWAKGEHEDIVGMTAVKCDRRISNPRGVVKLKVRIDSAPGDDFELEGGRQEVADSVVAIEQEDPAAFKTYLLPCTKEELSSYLAATPFIQSADERIVAQAKGITQGVLDAETVVRQIVEWVYANLEKKPTISIPSALEVLDHKRGDCNEHAALFTALARAVGVPTRVCVGLVCMGDGFYYHAWAEVFLGIWVAVDPVLGQFPADATHIRFVIGDVSDQLRMMRVVGRLQLEVLEYR
ncbi:MAG: transglutaminase domain-containing protein [Deltaproteobacteria bacterium]|nr:transglutaminase domain-containing protein [Deltaproteobacteria bacterium]